MPFPDESFASQVFVIPYQDRWAGEGAALVARLQRLLPCAAAADHIGSTSIPGMPAKDCIDAMVRPEEWNHVETLGAATHPNRVFAPPLGGRSVNIHIRERGSPTARYALLFRDYLRADASSRAAWGQFKAHLAETATDNYSYGQIKSTMHPLLMTLAEKWADDTSWSP